MTNAEHDKDMIESIEMWLHECEPKYVEKELAWLEELRSRLIESEIPNDLNGAANAYSNEHNDDCFDAIGSVCPHIIEAFKAGTEWQKAQDDRLVDIIYQQGIEKGKDEMRETLTRKEKK